MPPVRSEGNQFVDLPLINGGNAVQAPHLVKQPAVDVLGGGGAPLVSGANPSPPRDAGSNRGHVGDQDLSPVSEHDLGLVAADLLDDHESVAWLLGCL